MPEAQDPLRSLFQEAADSGRKRAATAPVEHIAERGRRVHRRHVTMAVVGVCLVLAGGGAAASALLPGKSPDTVPATTPSPGGPSPVPTTRPPSPDLTTRPPSLGSTGVPTGPPPPPGNTSAPASSRAPFPGSSATGTATTSGEGS